MRAAPSGGNVHVRRNGGDNDDGAGPEAALLLVNAGWDPIEFRFPETKMIWYQLLDGAKDDGKPDQDHAMQETGVTLQGHTVMMLGTHKVHE